MQVVAVYSSVLIDWSGAVNVSQLFFLTLHVSKFDAEPEERMVLKLKVNFEIYIADRKATTCI